MHAQYLDAGFDSRWLQFSTSSGWGAHNARELYIRAVGWGLASLGGAECCGVGAANVPDFYWGAKNISHGSMVVGAAMLANPKVKIVFIRISDVMTYQGNPIMGTQLSNIDAGLTSIATPIAATLWSTRFSGTWDQQYAQMKKLPTFQDQYKNTYYWIK